MSSSTLSSEALEQLNRENANKTELHASAKFATGKNASRKASVTVKIEKTGKQEKQSSSKKQNSYDEHECARFETHVRAWDKIADTSATTALITAIVFVFALSFIVSYDVTVFVNAKQRDNNTATTETNKIDTEFGKLVHAIFGILLATCVTSGLIGIIILSTHSNIIKNAQFKVLKYGKVTRKKMQSMWDLLTNFDQIAYVARFMGLIVCLGCFYLAVSLYFYRKLGSMSSGLGQDANSTGLVVLGIMGLGMVASACLFIYMTWISFRQQHLVIGCVLMNEIDRDP